MKFLQQVDTNSKLCSRMKAHSATLEAVGEMLTPSVTQQSMIPIMCQKSDKNEMWRMEQMND